MNKFGLVKVTYTTDPNGYNNGLDRAVIHITPEFKHKLKARSDLIGKDTQNGTLYNVADPEPFMGLTRMEYESDESEVSFFRDADVDELPIIDADPDSDDLFFMDDMDGFLVHSRVIPDAVYMVVDGPMVHFRADLDGVHVETPWMSVEAFFELNPGKEQLDVAESYASSAREIQVHLNSLGDLEAGSAQETLVDAITLGQNLIVQEWCKLTGKDEMQFRW